MSQMEIILLILGAVLFVASFIIPAQKEKVDRKTKEAIREEARKIVAREMESIKGHVDDVVDEAVGYAVEKTERSLERLTNEKIMAVNEYSDLVLEEIHKNHEEVVFLYDMLNSKHTNLKDTMSEVNKTVKVAEETKKEAEAVRDHFQRLTPKDLAQEEIGRVLFTPPIEKSGKMEDVNAFPQDTISVDSVGVSDLDISFIADDGERNSNEKILELYRQGKSNVAIAKQLGLGVGEVKLVIDLYKNI